MRRASPSTGRVRSSAGSSRLLLIKVCSLSLCLAHTHTSLSRIPFTYLTDPSTAEVPILGVQGSVLKEVADYMAHHKGTEPPVIEKPLRNKEMAQVCNEWDAAFIDKVGEDRQKLYDLILVCSSHLLLLTLARAAEPTFSWILRRQTTWISRACWAWGAPRLLLSSKVTVFTSQEEDPSFLTWLFYFLSQGQPLEKIKDILSAADEKKSSG